MPRRGKVVMEHAGRTMRALARPPSEDRSPRLDWGRIEAWAQQVAGGDLGQVNAVFEANGALAATGAVAADEEPDPNAAITLSLGLLDEAKGGRTSAREPQR